MGVGIDVGVTIALVRSRSGVPGETGAGVGEGRPRVGVISELPATDCSVLMGAGRVALAGGTPVGMGTGVQAETMSMSNAMQAVGASIHFFVGITVLILAYACVQDKITFCACRSLQNAL